MSSTVSIKAKTEIKNVTITNMDKQSHEAVWPIQLEHQWYKLVIPCDRTDIQDITIDGETIKHCLNAGRNTEKGYEIWLHGDLAEYFARISMNIAQDDLLRFKNLDSKYLLTESFNNIIEGEFIPKHVKSFFAKGEGPNWYHKSDFYNLPYILYNGPEVSKDIDLDEDLQFIDTKFYGQGKCKSLQALPVRPTRHIETIKAESLRDTLKQFGFSRILQIQYVELEPNSVIPVHRDDFMYEDGKDIIDGPTQLYFVLSGDSKDIHFKFKNVGLVDVSAPVFINNHKFVHSLVYTGKEKRGVLLVYGISDLTNKKFITE